MGATGALPAVLRIVRKLVHMTGRCDSFVVQEGCGLENNNVIVPRRGTIL
jgi:hypothetical protein